MKDRSALVVLAIVVGLLLACVMLPLGGFALLLVAAGGDSTPSGSVLPAPTWEQQAISGSTLGADERVLVLYVTGVIGAPDGGGVFDNVLTTEDWLSQIDQAANDDQISAVVVRVDSPGGGVVASNEIYNALVELSDTGKPVVVSMGATAASGGYYISAGADRIYANADTFTGSLGVVLNLLNYGEALDSIGVSQTAITSGDLKDLASPTRPLTDEERQILQSIVDQAYNGFVDVIVEGRNLPRNEVERIADGRIYTGAQALELGLVDELGNLDDAIAGAKELAQLPDDTLVVEYYSPSDFFSLLGASLEAQQQQSQDPLGLQEVLQPTAPSIEYRMIAPR